MVCGKLFQINAAAAGKARSLMVAHAVSPAASAGVLEHCSAVADDR